jgi:hypothetical protein
MNQRCSFLRKSSIPLLLTIAALTANPVYVRAAATYLASSDLNTAIQLQNMTYSYDPATKILTKTYELKNNSGGTLTNPRLVNLFLWSNNLCSQPSAAWSTMAYDGASVFSNLDQSATAANNTGIMDWSADVYPASFSSTQLFPSITPVQSVQGGVKYPYWTMGALWNNQDTRTITVQFSNVPNCSWIQNVVWVIYEGSAPPVTTTSTASPTTTTTATGSTTTTTATPTVIELSSFSAVPGDGHVTLMWRTESEIDTAGFNIYRGVIGSSEMTKLNDSLIPARGTAASGAEYTYEDDDVRNGTMYMYKLEDVATDGTVTEHKPVGATPRWIYGVFHK